MVFSTFNVRFSIGVFWFLVSDMLADHVAKDKQRREAYDKIEDVF
jgi:hypothetical protein